MSEPAHQGLLDGRHADAVGTASFVPRPSLEGALQAVLERTVGVQLVGEPGMGKTRLVRHTLGDRHALWVSCAEVRPLTARDLLGALLEQLDPSPTDLARLLRGVPVGAGGADEQLLLRAAGHRIAAVLPPVTVVVDDAEHLAPEEVAVLAGVIPVSERPWLVVTRAQLEDLPLPVVTVPPLSAAEAHQLVEGLLPGCPADVRMAVLDRAGDSPLFIEQCVALFLESGAIRMTGAGAQLAGAGIGSAVPSSMRAYVDQRLELLRDQELRAVGTAAVLGAQPERPLLEFLLGDERSAVEGLVSRGLLREGTDPTGQPVLRFAHALVREAAYERVAPPDRVRIHRAAAEWYAVLPVSQVLESQAFHLESAARLERPDCDLLRRTVEAMVLYARSVEEERTEAAHQVLLRARELAADRAECAVDLLQLELALASVHYIAGREGDATRSAHHALALAEERDDGRGIAEAHLQLGRIATDSEPAGSLRHLALAEEAFAGVADPGGQARVEVARGFVRQHAEGIAQQLEVMERAYHLALRSADTRLQAMCAQQIAMHQAFSMGRSRFEVWAERARDMSRRDDVGLEPRLNLAEAGLEMFDHNPAAGRQLAETARTAGRELGLRDVYANGLMVTVDLALVDGDLPGARAVLEEARAFAASRPSPWWSLQYDLIEARLAAREGDPVRAGQLLDAVAVHEMAENKVLRRDLAEARAWVALERGSFREARALASEAVGIDVETDERCSQLRPRLLELVSTVAVNDNVALGTIADLKALGRETGLMTPVQMALRWLYVEELTQGWDVDLHALEEPGTVECLALDLEIEALSSHRFEVLLDAAEMWSRLGNTVWRARALLWHSELTRTASPQAEELLATLQAPEGLARELRGQVAALKG